MVGGAVAPPVTPTSPLIALVDTILDATHPEIAGSNITTLGGRPLADFHGTATATVAAAPANGVGMLGIWPGARALNVPLPNGQQILCSDSARAIARAVRAGAAVINMSYGSPTRCGTEAQQIAKAVKAGAIPVAASGNEFASGNPLEFPASLPHVLTVAAIGPDEQADVVLERQRRDRPLGPRHRHPHRASRPASTRTAPPTASRPSRARRSRPRWCRRPSRGSAPRDRT